MAKLKGIKKAVGDFNRWQGCAIIVVDISDGEVWCDVFSSVNESKQYHSDTIHKILGKATWSIWERDDKTTMKEVTRLAEEKILD